MSVACQEPLAEVDDGGFVRAPLLDASVAAESSLPQPPLDAAPEADAQSAPFDAAFDAAIIAAEAGNADATPGRTNPVDIVDHAKWKRVDAAADPFGDRPAMIVCDPQATLAEVFSGVSAYDVDTGFCNYVTLHQPSTENVRAGETLSVRLAHFALTAPENSEAHLVVRIEELAILDEHVPIPSESQVLVRSVVATRDIPSGAEVYFHVHNHGQNSYSLLTVSTGP